MLGQFEVGTGNNPLKRFTGWIQLLGPDFRTTRSKRNLPRREDLSQLALLSGIATTLVCSESVIIEVSSSNSSVHNRKVTGTVQDFVSKSLILVTAEAIPVSTKVTVQSKDLLFLGEVLSCVADPGTKWRAHVRVKTSLLVV